MPDLFPLKPSHKPVKQYFAALATFGRNGASTKQADTHGIIMLHSSAFESILNHDGNAWWPQRQRESSSSKIVISLGEE